jgi:hypothetical protein
MRTVGITGHRAITQEPGELRRFARLSVARMVVEAMASEIITGMAMGWDLTVAEACIDLRVPFVAAVPFIRQPEHWKAHDRARWERCLLKAHHVNISSTLPGRTAYHDRNRWIVDQSEQLWALYDQRPAEPVTVSCMPGVSGVRWCRSGATGSSSDRRPPVRNSIYLKNRSALGSAMGLALAASANRQPPETAGVPSRLGGREPRNQSSRAPADRA